MTQPIALAECPTWCTQPRGHPSDPPLSRSDLPSRLHSRTLARVVLGRGQVVAVELLAVDVIRGGWHHTTGPALAQVAGGLDDLEAADLARLAEALTAAAVQLAAIEQAAAQHASA